MRTSRPAYLMAMLAGLVIVGASTGGVVVATHHHDHTVALAASVAGPSVAAPVASAAPASSAPPVASAAPAGSPAVPSSAAPVANSAAPVTSSTAPVASSAAPVASSAAPVTSSTPSATRSPAPVTSNSAAPSGRPASSASSSKPVAAAQKFRDGTYSATGSYNSPGGIEKLGVTITLTADKVTKSDLDLLGGAGLSHSFQSAFASGYSGQVIGKDISTIKLGAVSGSSLTGMGFNAAVEQIETQAEAAG